MTPQRSSEAAASSPSFLHLPDEDCLSQLQKYGKYKQRSHNTYHTTHLPELNHRLSLNLILPSPPPFTNPNDDPFAPHPVLSNNSKIEVVYLGNSMLERLKTTGRDTKLTSLCTSWNAGCGGDKNENVLYRLSQGMYSILKEPNSNLDIKLWVLASGTNNVHAKRGFRDSDVESYRLLLEACLRMAPRSVVLACDVFYRKDVKDSIVEEVNRKMRHVVEALSMEMVGEGQQERVVWVEARNKIAKDMLVDHVHLNEEGYRVWDEVLWAHVDRVLERRQSEEQKM